MIVPRGSWSLNLLRGGEREAPRLMEGKEGKDK